jgi:hypothetical protein
LNSCDADIWHLAFSIWLFGQTPNAKSQTPL